MIEPNFLAHKLSELVPKARKFLLAVSGGADSVALLRLMHAGGSLIEVAHLDHGLRKNAVKDAAFVRALCEDLGVAYHTESVEVAKLAQAKAWNLEDAARKVRYNFLYRCAKQIKADCVLTAHTLDDQAETVIMQLLRGAAYLSGIREVNKQLVRPLLSVSKRELIDHLDAIEQAHVIDESNQDVSRTRAWLRHEILPSLKARYPSIVNTLANLAAIQQAQLLHMEKQGKSLIKERRLRERDILAVDLAVRRQAIFELLTHFKQSPSSEKIEAILASLETNQPRRFSLSPEWHVRKAYGYVDVVRSKKKALSRIPVSKHEQLPENVSKKILDLYPDLVFRGREAGDRISLSAGSKKLSDFFIDKKVPLEERDAIKILASGKRVFWLEGLVVDPSVAVVTEDERFMREALALAKEGAEKAELPVGAVVVKDGQIIARAHNTTEHTCDPTAHAEVLALKRAAKKLGDWRLVDCSLYVTLEPCSMCFGAILQAHLPRLIYGAANHREGVLGSLIDLQKVAWKTKLHVTGDVLAGACKEVLEAFFTDKRSS